MQYGKCNPHLMQQEPVLIFRGEIQNPGISVAITKFVSNVLEKKN